MAEYRHTIKCLHPIKIVNPRYKSERWEREGDSAPWRFADYNLLVPCGHCYLCRKRKAQDWHVRLFHEYLGTPYYYINGKKQERNVLFCTFTFNNKYLPDDNPEGLRSRLAPYIRKWRDNWRKRFGVSPRYWCTTDIGNEGRLHLHMLIFNPVNKDGVRITKSSIFSTGNQWRNLCKKKGLPEDTPIDYRRQLMWKYGFCTYCQYLRDESGIHYVSGYLTGSNVLKQIENGDKVLKHKKELCKKAVQHVPVVFVSSGLGKSFLTTKEFDKLKTLKSFICSLGKYKYAVPRYFRANYFEDTTYLDVDESTGELYEFTVPADEQARRFIASLMFRLQDDLVQSDSVCTVLNSKKYRQTRAHLISDNSHDPPYQRAIESLDKVFGYTPPSPRPVDHLMDFDSVSMIPIHADRRFFPYEQQCFTF